MADDPLRALLRLQDADLDLDRLGHRRRTLPERDALAREQAVVAAVEGELATVAGRADELAKEIRRREDEVAANEARVASLEATLASGGGGAPRDVAAIADEVASIRRRVRMLEDQLLDLLEEAETTAATRSGLERRRDEGGAVVARQASAVADIEAELDAEEARTVPQRAALAAALPADLLATYERLRARLGGVAVATLEGNRCGGCHLTLPATELDALRRAPADAIVRHEECGRILVRPA
jgi:predicted  nucleic acid-binding Zn-ribbon protein